MKKLVLLTSLLSFGTFLLLSYGNQPCLFDGDWRQYVYEAQPPEHHFVVRREWFMISVELSRAGLTVDVIETQEIPHGLIVVVPDGYYELKTASTDDRVLATRFLVPPGGTAAQATVRRFVLEKHGESAQPAP